MDGNNAPIWGDAQRLLLLTEEAVRRFPRYDKYILLRNLRRKTLRVCWLVKRAWRNQDGRQRHPENMVLLVDEYKLLLQLSKEMRAFAGFGQAELSVALANEPDEPGD